MLTVHFTFCLQVYVQCYARVTVCTTLASADVLKAGRARSAIYREQSARILHARVMESASQAFVSACLALREIAAKRVHTAKLIFTCFSFIVIYFDRK